MTLQPVILFVSFLALFGATGADAQSRIDVVYQAPTHLAGVAAGDLDPKSPGLEIAVVGDRALFVLRQVDGRWVASERARFPGEVIQCAVGRLNPKADHEEVVVGGVLRGGEDDGGPGAVWRVGPEGDPTLLFEDRALVHAVAIDRGQIWAAGFSGHLQRLDVAGGAKAPTAVVALPAPAKTLAPLGEGVALGLMNGQVVWAREGREGGRLDVLAEGAVARSRLCVEGGRVLCADDAGGLDLIVPGQPPRRVLQVAGKLRGAAFAELDPAHPGLEIATCGYDGALHWARLLSPKAPAPSRVERPYRDLAKAHHLVAADLDGDGRASLILVNYAGRVVILHP